MDKIDRLRLKEISLKMAQQTVIELAYTARTIIEPLAESHEKLSFSEANCYLSVFYAIRQFLKSVDSEYLNRHQRIAEFFLKNRELSNDWDRLRWEEGRFIGNCPGCGVPLKRIDGRCDCGRIPGFPETDPNFPSKK